MKDALELELRQLPGVSFVSFFEEEGTSYIELVVAEGVEHAKVREEAARSVVNYLEAPAEIRVLTVPSEQPPELGQRGRVKLVVVLPSDGGAAIEVQLSQAGREYTSQAVAGDTIAVGRAVLEALRGLDILVPYEVVGLYALPSALGAGLLAVLRETSTGQLRRGVASGRAPADAAARAVLNALNRSL